MTAMRAETLDSARDLFPDAQRVPRGPGHPKWPTAKNGTRCRPIERFYEALRRARAETTRTLRRLEESDPDRPKLPVFFVDGPSRFVSFVAFWDEPEQRIEGELATYDIDASGNLVTTGAQPYVYTFAGFYDGFAMYALEVAE